MKIIMEGWRQQVLREDLENPETWGELSQKIMMTLAAERWPRVGKSLSRFGWKLMTGAAKSALSAVEGLEDVLDIIPDELQKKLEDGAEGSIQSLANLAKTKGGAVGAFVIDDLIGMDDSLTKNLAGFSVLNIEDEYEKLIDKKILKSWAKNIIRTAKDMPPDDPLPDLNKKLEDDLQGLTGAHPDTDWEDVRKKKEQELEEIIVDELRNVIVETQSKIQEFGDLGTAPEDPGDNKMSATDQTRKMKSDATQASSQKITPRERKLIEKIKDIITAYSEKHNLESGNIYAGLNKVAKAMTKKIQSKEKTQPQLES